MSFFGNLVQLSGGAAGGFAQGVRQIQEREMAQQRLDMEQYNMEQASMSRTLDRMAAGERHKRELEFDRSESLRRREEAAGSLAERAAGEGYNVTLPDPGMPYTPPQFSPMTDEELSPLLRARVEAERARAGMYGAQGGYYERDRPSSTSATPRFNDAERAQAQGVIQQVTAQYRDFDPRADELAKQLYEQMRQSGLANSVSEQGLWLAISAGLADYWEDRRNMSMEDRMMEGMMMQEFNPSLQAPVNEFEDNYQRRRGPG